MPTWRVLALWFAAAAPGPREPDVDALVAHFPPPAVARAELAFAEAHLAWLDSRAAFSPEEWTALEAAKHEVEWAKGLWEDLAAAQDPGGCDATRRYCVDALRAKLGRGAFARGEIPPPVAWGMLRRID